MDRDITNSALERLLARASQSALKSLNARVDIDRRLRDLRDETANDPQTDPGAGDPAVDIDPLAPKGR